MQYAGKPAGLPARVLIKISLLLAVMIAGAMACSNVTAGTIQAVPGVYGFGAATAAGRGGTVYKVTNLNENGTGSLRWAIEQKGPRIIIFEVSGNIKLINNLNVNEPFVTIAGQTAPSPGIMISGATLVIKTHDVLIQHLRVRAGDDPQGPSSTDRDCLQIAYNGRHPTNIVIDHCTFNWSLDEAGSTWYDVGDITVNQCMFAEPLDKSIHIDEGGSSSSDPHGYNFITGCGSPDARISLTGTLFAHSRERNPMSISPNLVFCNNVVYNTIQRMTHLHNRDNYRSMNSIVGNVYINGPSRDKYETSKPITISSEFYTGSLVYLQDNHSPDHAYTDQWDLVTNQSDIPVGTIRTEQPPVWVNGLKVRPTAGDEVLDWVLESCGARPADRDSVEKRIVDDVRKKGGSIKNSVAEAGGWPVYAANRRIAVLPLDPTDDQDGDGYTNLDEWLQDRAYEVEGRDMPAGSYRLPSTGSSNGTSDPQDGFPQIHEAESAYELSGAVAETVNSGYSGEAYVNYEPNIAGGYIKWHVNVPKDGRYRIEFRYSNAGAANRPADIRVNDMNILKGVAFPGTGAWNAWKTVFAEVQLAAGHNTVALVAAGSEGGANIDVMKVYDYYSDNAVDIFIDGVLAQIEKGLGQPYIDVNNRTQVPLRWFAGLIGAVVEYDHESLEVTISKGSTILVIKIGSRTYKINGSVKTMDTEAYLSKSESRTYVPVRYVAEPFDYGVTFVINKGQISESAKRNIVMLDS